MAEIIKVFEGQEITIDENRIIGGINLIYQSF